MAGSVLGAPGSAAADAPLAPGQTRTVVLAVPSSWSEQATQVGVTALRLVQAENGCLEVEAAAGDDCTSEAGELAGKLSTTVTWGRTVAGECLAGGPAVPLDLFGSTAARLTEVSGIDCLLLAMAFPHGGADDLAQSDTLAFGLELVGQGLAGLDGAADDDDAGPGRTDGDQDRGDAGGAGPSGGGTGQGVGTQPAGTQGAGTAAAGTAAVGTAGAVTDGGPVLDRMEAQVSVGGDGVGVGVQTRAAGTSLQVLVLAWGGALLGMVGLGWMLFLLVLRRRRRTEAAA